MIRGEDQIDTRIFQQYRGDRISLDELPSEPAAGWMRLDGG
jgi:hypothetical protein